MSLPLLLPWSAAKLVFGEAAKVWVQRVRAEGLNWCSRSWVGIAIIQDDGYPFVAKTPVHEKKPGKKRWGQHKIACRVEDETPKKAVLTADSFWPLANSPRIKSERCLNARKPIIGPITYNRRGKSNPVASSFQALPML